MSDPPEPGARRTEEEYHLATVSHDGRFWDAYLVFEETEGAPRTQARARVRFSAPMGVDGGSEPNVRTAVIFVEDSFEAAMAKARSFGEHQLVGLLRSALPD